MSRIHPLVKKASKGKLPEWAKVSKGRYAHMERVAALLEEWARAADLSKRERQRWVALGYLHDALKGASPGVLRPGVRKDLRGLPDSVLHGPAASARLEEEGVEDQGLLLAVRYHTLGHPSLDDAGKALYVADFLDPGRNLRNSWRAGLRSRMPGDLDEVTREVVGARVAHLIKKGRPVLPETLAFWNSLVGGEPWAPVSEA
ncbi:MAG: HD domain-containing protein [Gemmatimonadales bacterium]|jgi:2-amino-4-hydroxy-6-hydroxymethyldihydropteridine diphosphokinase|nr:MAG: HD domain-containing protein [Gemmatimonadales bacterium]